ncbi:MAG TPA: ABC transporter permease [Baekduia sp.]|uniref:ABC transporter permease n=1 Tax=Baekduia sp. TaxID=2600305 RepID=UPI002D79EB08|nr:ABC transporter permease [Baekduia sp.]HET6509098.1 ABC transporter permease [Baekduia sp.]
MARFVLIRLASMVATVAVASMAIFAALFLAPGSPISFIVGGRSVSPERLAQLNQQYHLDDPFLVRWWDWSRGAVHGDFGQSIVRRTDVWSVVEPRLGASVILVIYSAILIMIVGVALGMLSGLRGGWVDRSVTFVTSLGLATPAFVAAIVLIWLFAVELPLFPVFGGGSGLADQLYHLTLPAVALALAGGAYVARVTRAAVREENQREHVETARARGLPERLVIRRHVVRNAMIPITTVAGLTVASLIAGTVVVETAFGIDGIGSLLVQSVQQKDFAVVQAVTLLMVVAFVVLNTVVDLLYSVLDPRLSLGRGARG